MTLVHPLYMPATAQPPPPMWNSGIATRLTVSGSNSQISLATGSSPKKLALVSMTPFGRPVVPLEYSWKAMSSSVLVVPGIGGRLRRHGGVVVVVAGRGAATVVADHEHGLCRRQVGRDGVEHRHEVLADDQHLRLGVVDDVLDLGWGQAPVDVDADRVQQSPLRRRPRSARCRSCRGTPRGLRLPTPTDASRLATRQARSYSCAQDIVRSPRMSAGCSARPTPCTRMMSDTVLIPMRAQRQARAQWRCSAALVAPGVPVRHGGGGLARRDSESPGRMADGCQRGDLEPTLGHAEHCEHFVGVDADDGRQRRAETRARAQRRRSSARPGTRWRRAARCPSAHRRRSAPTGCVAAGRPRSPAPRRGDRPGACWRRAYVATHRPAPRLAKLAGVGSERS